MKISQIYKLNKTQYELDFVDIDPEIDTPLFLDPYYISKCDFDFAITADSSIRSYFEFLLALLRNNDVKEAEELFSYLGEIMIFVLVCLVVNQMVMVWGRKIQV